MKESCKTNTRDLKTVTQLTSQDQIEVEKNIQDTGGVSEKDVEKDVEMINPDPDSMESRG